jgi:hypothetical protein
MIIGIDPGGSKDHAISWFSGDKWICSDKTSDIHRISKIIKGIEKVYIESQYYGGNAATLILLCHRVGMIQGICELFGIEYTMVAPSTWQASIGLPRKPKGISSNKWKKQHEQDIIAMASDVAGIEQEDSDIAASILIGYHAARRAKN